MVPTTYVNSLFREALIIAFQTKTSEIDSGKADDQNARRWCYSPSRTHFGLSTQPTEIAAVCSQNELLEVPTGLTREAEPSTVHMTTCWVQKDKGTTDMGEKAKGRKEEKKKAKLSPKDKRKAKKEKKK